MLTTFGTPWPDPRSLTVSFPTDEAQIGAYSNSLRYTLDQVADRQQWQESVLRSLQTWAVETNLNIGLTADRGDHFGSIGLSQGDPRFGDIRIGAFPQQGVLANALPFQTIAGTWSGDVLLNSQTNYFLGDWQSGTRIDIPQANQQRPAVELYSVLLHEAGNSLGLADWNRPGTVMHATYEGPKGSLATADIAAIRQLYGGARQDIHEPTRNDRFRDATLIKHPAGFTADDPLTVRGSLNRRGDIDHYRFAPLPSQEKMTVRLRAAGISLLKAHLFVLDARGNVIADAKADSIFDNDLALEVGSLQDHRQLYVRVVANSSDVFAIGDYELVLDYRPKELQPQLIPVPFDADATDDDDTKNLFDPDEVVDVIFSRFGLVDREVGVNDSLSTATPLVPTQGFLIGTRYEAQAALNTGDVDFYRFTTPGNVSGSISVKLETVGLETPILHADVLDVSGTRVPARAMPRADGSVSFEILDPMPSANYFIRVRSDAVAVMTTGNYVVTVDAATEAATVAPLLEGQARAGEEGWAPVRVYKTQLFRFDLQARGAPRDHGVTMTLYEAKTAQVVFSLSAASGRTVTEFVWLQQGDYFVRTAAIGSTGTAIASVEYRLAADGISDDQGPLQYDPSNPYAGIDTYADPYGGLGPGIYPLLGPTQGLNPYLPDPGATGPYQPPPYEIPPAQDPWYFDLYYEYYYDFYSSYDLYGIG